MSLLLVDVGNSRVKWRWQGHDRHCAVDELVDGVPPPWQALPSPTGVRISVVSAPRRAAMVAWCLSRWGIDPCCPDGATPLPGVVNGYAEPAQLGVDRWLALAAVRALGAQPALVVDAGTAVTMDLLDGDGLFRGGMILPGRRLLGAAFRQQVPYLDAAAEKTPDFPARTTADAIALGAQFALVASLERFIDNARSLLGEEPALHLTGGDGAWLQSRHVGPAALHRNLVLDGLSLLKEQTA